MTAAQIALLALIQGAAELLPVSSSAHVITAEKLMGLDPTAPEMTLLLVMLHTGTMFAVIVYFWRSWKQAYFSSWSGFRQNATGVVLATACTGIVGLGLQYGIKHWVLAADPNFEIEHLFGNSRLMAAALAAAGVLIIAASLIPERTSRRVGGPSAMLIGAVQGLCLPFRGFSRSGATISTAMAVGIERRKAEEFSFALAVVLTPAVIVKEAHRLLTASGTGHAMAVQDLGRMLAPSAFGMVLSFLAGLAALRWLSSWLESGRWYLFGAYCLVASGFVLWLG